MLSFSVELLLNYIRYKSPVGPRGHYDPMNPKGERLIPYSKAARVSLKPHPYLAEYLKSLVHSAALCDRCMTSIQGEWFRCAYCPKDLCDACEALDTHNNLHVFFVFKAPVSSNFTMWHRVTNTKVACSQTGRHEQQIATICSTRQPGGQSTGHPIPCISIVTLRDVLHCAYTVLTHCIDLLCNTLY